MSKVSNILLTSIGIAGDRRSHRYFYVENNGVIKYCDGLSIGEAGAKYILSCEKIDGIIVLGKGNAYEEGEELKTLVLREWSDFDSESTDGLSEYSFFQYRLSQFLDSLDMEAIDVLEDIEPARKEAIIRNYTSFCEDIADEVTNIRPDSLFHTLAQNYDVYDKLKTYFPGINKKEYLWLQRYIYSQLSDTRKLTPLEGNSDITICFVPTADKQRDYVPMRNVRQIVDSVSKNDADVINLYIDMQGLDSADGYTILAVLSMLSNDVNNRINIKEIITSHYDPARFVNIIDNNEMSRYDINKLVSGMDAFVRYGKVDQVQAYWESRGISNVHIENLLYAMKTVDEGISLCNVADMERGVDMLRQLFQSDQYDELPKLERDIFSILQEGIRMDYGALVEGDRIDELDLVKWAMRKKFYQQSLTLVEARFTERIVDTGILYYATDEESKQAFLEEINRNYWKALPKDRWWFDDVSHYFIKTYGRDEVKYRKGKGDRNKMFADFRVEALYNPESTLMKPFSMIDDKPELLTKLLAAYYTLGNVRNSINHANDSGLSDKEPDIHSENENLKLLKNSVLTFLEYYEEALRAIEEKGEEKHIVMITRDEIIKYANAHKLFYDPKSKKLLTAEEKKNNQYQNNDVAPNSNKDSDQNQNGKDSGGYKGNGYKGNNGNYKGGYKGGYKGNGKYNGGNHNNYSVNTERRGNGNRITITIDID